MAIVALVAVIVVTGYEIYRIMFPPGLRTLVISHWGFAWDEIEEIVIRPFEEEYNCKVVLVPGKDRGEVLQA